MPPLRENRVAPCKNRETMVQNNAAVLYFTLLRAYSLNFRTSARESWDRLQEAVGGPVYMSLQLG